MKKYIATIVIFFALISSSYAQQQRPRERIRAFHVAYITDRLQLTSEQSARFWPVFDQFEDEVKTARRSFADKNDNNHAGSDSGAMQYIDDNLEMQQRVIDLKRKYKDQFLKIISPQQLADLYKAERDFKQMLIQQMKKRGGGGGNGDRGGRWNNNRY